MLYGTTGASKNTVNVALMSILHRSPAIRPMRIYSAAFTLWSEKGAENYLDTPLLGPTPLYWDPFSSYYSPTSIYKSDKLADFGSLVRMITITFGVVAFEA